MNPGTSSGAPATDDTGDGFCEWPVQLHYLNESRSCGRAAPSLWGLRLCWQHSDKALSYVINRLHDGRLQLRELDEIVQAVLSSIRQKRDERTGQGRSSVAFLDAIEAEMLHRLREGDLSTPLREALERYLSEQMARTWGAA